MNKISAETKLEQLRSIALSDASKERIRGSLAQYATFHSVSQDVRVRDTDRFIKRVPQRTSLHLALHRLATKSMMTAALIIALAVGGGTSYAAEYALPGDLLYPIKVEVNENIESMFALGTAAEAEFQAGLVEERVTEAEILAARGELDAETSAAIRSRIQAHYEQALEGIKAAEASGDLETSAAVRSSLSSALDAHAAILGQLDADAHSETNASLIADMEAYADTLVRGEVRIETSTDASADLSATLESAESLIADVTAELARAEAKLDAGAHAQLTTKLDNAVEAHAAANAAFEAGQYQEAYANAQSALRTANSVDTTIESVIRLNIRGLGAMNVGSQSETTTETTVEGEDTQESSDEQTEDNINGELDASTSVGNEGDTSVRTDVRLGF